MHWPAVRHVLLTFYIQCAAGIAVAQVTLKGRISDGQHALPMATIVLLQTDSSLVKGVITDSLGEFAFENVAVGRYMIATSMIGYSKYIAPVMIDNANVVLPGIILTETSTTLSGFYQSKTISGITTFAPIGSLNTGVQKKIGQGALKLAMDDILYTNYWRIRSYSPENNIYSRTGCVPGRPFVLFVYPNAIRFVG